MMIILWTVKVGSSDIFYNRISNRQQKIINVVLQIIAAIRINEITKIIQKENQLGTLYVGRKDKFEKNMRNQDCENTSRLVHFCSVLCKRNIQEIDGRQCQTF